MKLKDLKSHARKRKKTKTFTPENGKKTFTVGKAKGLKFSQKRKRKKTKILTSGRMKRLKLSLKEQQKFDS